MEKISILKNARFSVNRSIYMYKRMEIRKIYCVKLDHPLYLINYSIYYVYIPLGGSQALVWLRSVL